ncbi:MAG: acyl-CoA dehydrogenase family protein [Symbiobacteriia bacterium]
MYDFMLTPEERQVRDEARRFVREDVPRELLLAMDAEQVQYPREFLEKAAAAHLLGLRFPAEYGGRGLSWVAEAAAIEEMGVLGTALACLYSLPSIVGEAIMRFGTEDQRRKYLAPTLHGVLTTAEGLTEPRGGSDFFGAVTRARREGDYYILDGQKRFVVGAEGADYFMVYARTDPDAKPHEGMSAFLVERGSDVKVEYVYGLMGTRGGGTGRVRFNQVKVPAANLLGRENGASDIFYRMMIPERLTSAAGALGMARAALEVAADYTTKRKAFGRKIRDFQAVSFKVADSVTQLDAARGIVSMAARAADEDREPALVRRLVSEAKKFATDTAWAVVNNAMQVMGGIGYTNVYPVERLLRDTRLIMIWTGTNEIMDSIIQHEYYTELKAGRKVPARDTEADAREADKAAEKIYE